MGGGNEDGRYDPSMGKQVQEHLSATEPSSGSNLSTTNQEAGHSTVLRQAMPTTGGRAREGCEPRSSIRSRLSEEAE